MNRTLILVLLIVIFALIAVTSTVMLITGSMCSKCECPECPEIPEWCSAIIPSQKKGGVVFRGDANRFMNNDNVVIEDNYVKHLDHIYLKPGKTFKLNNAFVERGTIGCIVNPNQSHQCVVNCQSQNIAKP